MVTYWLQATCYGVAFYGIYYFCSRNAISYTWNRFYLLSVALFPALLPLLKLPVLPGLSPIVYQQYVVYLSQIDVTPESAVIIGMSIKLLAIIVYSTVVLLLFARLLLAYWHISNLVKMSVHKQSITDSVTLLQHTGFGPGSFGKYIFIPDADIHPDILQHELAHIRLKHSYDILLVQIVKAIFWIFPITYVVSNELKTIHEFEADSAVDADPDAYSKLLLSEVFGVKHIQIAHSFFNHPIKRRLTMLQKKTISRSKVLGAIFRSSLSTILLTTSILYLQSCSREQKVAAVSNPHDVSAQEAYNEVDVMPKPNCDLPKYLGENIKYPKLAKEQKVEGRVIVKFVVDKEGNITTPSVVKSPNPLLSEEAVRVVMSMPRWEPGVKDGKNVPVNFYIPISFKL